MAMGGLGVRDVGVYRGKEYRGYACTGVYWYN